MSQNGKMMLLGLLALVLIGIGVADLFTTDAYTIVAGNEGATISYYLWIGIALLILAIVGLVRGNKRIK